MKIYYSKVARQSNRLRLTVDDTGFMLEQAPIQYALNGTVEIQDRLPAEFDPLLTYDVRFSDITQRADFSDHAAYNLSSGTKVRPLFNFWKYTLAARMCHRTGFPSMLFPAESSAYKSYWPLKCF